MLVLLKSFNINEKKNILINIIQDRENIENHQLLEKNFELIFENFKDISNEFQIGTTINRLKWGFFSTAEFMSFYMVAQKNKRREISNYKTSWT